MVSSEHLNTPEPLVSRPSRACVPRCCPQESLTHSKLGSNSHGVAEGVPESWPDSLCSPHLVPLMAMFASCYTVVACAIHSLSRSLIHF